MPLGLESYFVNSATNCLVRPKKVLETEAVLNNVALKPLPNQLKGCVR